ncbi:MAG: IS21 family transposase [Rhizobiales bacterium]|nr:IS21 family transposase [Hyphomicrobiales bacterium]
MLEPEEVSAILRLNELGWGAKRIARELGISRNTAKDYIAAGGWTPYRQPQRKKALDDEEAWLRQRFRRHRGNADVIRQELAAEKGIVVSLRTVERAVEPYRQELAAEARATVRFETPPGKQLQIDFGERLVEIGGSKVRAYLFVATLGYSRRHHVRAFCNERQESWFDGLESAFGKFGGVPEEVLFDNARALVIEHDPATRTVLLNDKLKAFAKHWGFRPRACAPYRARTKGKTENGVGYVKRNAIAGRSFPSWEAFEAHLEAWTREVADVRLHGTTGEAPIERFRRAEAKALKPIVGIPPFQAAREVIRRVQSDCAVEIDGNAYSVPWRLIGETVRATIVDGTVRIHQGAQEVAVHPICTGRRRRVIDPGHFEGLSGFRPSHVGELASPPTPALLRPLGEYEAIVGGSF